MGDYHGFTMPGCWGDVVFFTLEVLHMLGNDGKNRRNPREVPARSQKPLGGW